ncbi:MAG: DUF4160 domain-containing protein [Chloroflexota bacterium]|nr:DUF4160 domain-containing protein [Chloroflexota bacterium]
MPKVYEESGYKFIIFTNDHAPAHVHVLSPDGMVKIALDDDATVIKNTGVKAGDLKKMRKIVRIRIARLRDGWNALHPDKKV